MIKRLLLTIFLFSLVCYVRAQQYVPMLDSLNKWSIVQNWIPLAPPGSSNQYLFPPCSYPAYNLDRLYTDSDTIINSISYRKVFCNSFWGGSDCVFGYMREDTALRKVYFINNQLSQEETLYDFSLAPGDSFLVQYYQPVGYRSSGYYTVDSIYSVSTAAGTRRQFHLSKHPASAWSGDQLNFIEGVGCLDHPFYTYSENAQGGLYSMYCNSPSLMRDAATFLSCYEHNIKVYYDSCAIAVSQNDPCLVFTDSCTYGTICGKVPELKGVTNFKLVPNPAQQRTELLMDINNSGNFEISLKSLDGKLTTQIIYSGNITEGIFRHQIDLSKLASGVYILECRNEFGRTYQKLIVY